MSSTPNRPLAWVAVAAVGIVAGVAQGFVWAATVPQERWMVYADSPDPLSLPTESTHRFTSIGLFALMSVVIGIVLGVAAWQIRFARGLTTLLAAGGGAAVGSVAALLIGPAVAGGVIPAELAAAGVDHDQMVTMIPAISWTLMAIAPLGAVVLYTFLSAWHPEPHLGSPPPAPAAEAAGDADQHQGAPANDAITAPIPVVRHDPAPSDSWAGQPER